MAIAVWMFYDKRAWQSQRIVNVSLECAGIRLLQIINKMFGNFLTMKDYIMFDKHNIVVTFLLCSMT